MRRGRRQGAVPVAHTRGMDRFQPLRICGMKLSVFLGAYMLLGVGLVAGLMITIPIC